MTSLTIHPSRAEALKEIINTVTQCSSFSTPCGSLACQKNSFLTSTSSPVVAHTYFKEPEAKSKKKKSSSPPPPPSSGSAIICFEDSVFFPAGGGQPCDKGTISINPDLTINVTNVENVSGLAILTCQIPPTTTPESLSSTLSTLITQKTPITQAIDWKVRADYMQQHSAQHLISAIAMEPEYKIDTQSWSLQEGLTCYIDFTVDPDKPIEHYTATFADIESVVNAKIRDNLSMTPSWMDPNDPEFKEKVRSRLLPPGLTGDIRLVEIAGVDVNTCCGTHVPTLSHLQLIKFFKFQKVKSTTLRVSYAAGQRLIDSMAESFDRTSKITSILTVNENGHVDSVTKLIEEKKSSEKEIRALNQKLVDLQIATMMAADDNVVSIDLGAADKSFMICLATSFLSLESNKTCLMIEGAEGKDEGSFFLVGPESVVGVKGVGAKVGEILGGKGGGKGSKFQGKGASVRSGLADAVIYLSSTLNQQL